MIGKNILIQLEPFIVELSGDTVELSGKYQAEILDKVRVRDEYGGYVDKYLVKLAIHEDAHTVICIDPDEIEQLL
jgi:hypothetical protein